MDIKWKANKYRRQTDLFMIKKKKIKNKTKE